MTRWMFFGLRWKRHYDTFPMYYICKQQQQQQRHRDTTWCIKYFVHVHVPLPLFRGNRRQSMDHFQPSQQTIDVHDKRVTNKQRQAVFKQATTYVTSVTGTSLWHRSSTKQPRTESDTKVILDRGRNTIQPSPNWYHEFVKTYRYEPHRCVWQRQVEHIQGTLKSLNLSHKTW